MPKQTVLKKRKPFLDMTLEEAREDIKQFKKLDDWIERSKFVSQESMERRMRSKEQLKRLEQMKQLRKRVQESLKVSREALERRMRTQGMTAQEKEKLLKKRADIDFHVVSKLIESGTGEMRTVKTCIGIGMSPNYAKLLVKRARNARLAQGKRQ